MKLKIDDKLMFGDYTEQQIDLIDEELKKPKHKRNYIMGIELSEINKIEVILCE